MTETQQTHRKVLIIGLDGVPLTLLQPWLDQGQLPTLQRVIEQGCVAPLNSTIPHTSGPAWSSYMTGKNPGKTGIYDFLYRHEGTYAFYPNNAQRRTGQSLWRLLSETGKRVIVLNVPLTYPVEPLNGIQISGFLTPYTAENFAYPPEIIAELESHFGHYEIYPLATFNERQSQAYFDACHRLADQRTEIALYLMQNKPWDFFNVVYFDTDRVQHQLWHYLDPDHPWRAGDKEDRSTPVLHYFQHLDRCIARLIEQAGENTLTMVMSDHGMGTARQMIVLNTWLLNQGLLQLKRNPLTKLKHLMFRNGFTLRTIHQWAGKLGLAHSAEYKAGYFVEDLLRAIFLSFSDVDWSKSIAYSFGRSTGPIFLNLKGREPQGIVTPGAEYEAWREKITKMASDIVDPQTGVPLVGEVRYREDIYHGPHFEQAPDLMFFPRDPANKFYGLTDFGSRRVVEPMYRYSGMHRQHGMLMMTGPAIRPAATLQTPQITDIAPTVLYAMGLPIPDDMDGRPLTEAFAFEPTNTELSKVSAQWATENLENSQGLTPQQAQQVEDRLRQLGYLG